jgi:UbiD family decarboxylase
MTIGEARLSSQEAPPAPVRWCDLREWLTLADNLGEVRHVEGATAEADIGAITEMLERDEDAPAALFDRIPGYAPGYRVLSNSMGSRRRQAITLGLDPARATHEYLLAYWRGVLRGGLATIPPVLVPRERASVCQNVQGGADVDLTRFPAPIWHPLDGGPFIGTASLNILRDPESGTVNVGSYRNQVFDRNHVGFRAAPTHHGGVISQKYLRRGRPCPIAIAVGSDPLLFLAACAEGPPLGMSELDWAGGIRGQAVEVFEGEVTGLPIPAHAEIVLEGFLGKQETYKEGPYGEWMGYYQDGYANDHSVRVERVYFRDEPIILGCPQGKPPHEDNRFLAYLRSGMIWDQLEKAGVPGVHGVWCPPEGGNRLMTVVSVKQQYAGHAKQAGLIASQCSGGLDNNRLTVVVDEHVDVTNLADVVWAMLTRCDPERGVDIIGGTKGSRIDMAIAPAQRELNLNSRMIVDATTSFNWKDHPLAGTPIQTRERTRATQERWGWLLRGAK